MSYLVESCTSCSLMLSESLQKKPTIQKTKDLILFQQASSIPQLRLDIEKIDSILNFLRINQVIGIVGYNCQKIIERLCVRAQLPKKHGGLDTSVVIIDGGNSSDPYLCISFARQYGLQVDRVLSRIISSRAFTVDQLWCLVTSKLPNIITKYNARIVVISDLLNMFVDDPFLDKNESWLMLDDIIKSISKIHGCIIVVSISRLTEYDNMVSKLFDRTIRISKQQYRLDIQVDDKVPAQIKEIELELIPQR
jgi:hypothetical protein